MDNIVSTTIFPSNEVNSSTDHSAPRIGSRVVEIDPHAYYSSDRNCWRIRNWEALNLGGPSNAGSSVENPDLSIIRLNLGDVSCAACGDLHKGGLRLQIGSFKPDRRGDRNVNPAIEVLVRPHGSAVALTESRPG